MPTIILAVLLAAAGLVDAVKSGDRAAALALLQQKVNVNTPESDGTTALPGSLTRRRSAGCFASMSPSRFRARMKAR